MAARDGWRAGMGTGRWDRAQRDQLQCQGTRTCRPPTWRPRHVPLSEPGQAVVMLVTPGWVGGSPGVPLSPCRSHGVAPAPVRGAMGPHRAVCSALVKLLEVCRRVLELQAGGGTGWHRTLQGQGWPPPSPNPLQPLMGHRDPPQTTTRLDAGGNAGTGVPKLVAVGACPAAGGGGMNSPASPWELLSGRGRVKVPKSLGAGAVPSGTSDPGCMRGGEIND